MKNNQINYKGMTRVNLSKVDERKPINKILFYKTIDIDTIIYSEQEMGNIVFMIVHFFSFFLKLMVASWFRTIL